MFRLTRLLLIASGLSLLLITPAAASPPNIVLIISDDHAWTDFGFMGSPHVETPNLDGLAEAGTVYTHGHAPASVCQPSLQTLLTGLHPEAWKAQVAAIPDPPANPNHVVQWFTTLPDHLATAGYVSWEGGKHWEGTWEMAGFSGGMADEIQFPPKGSQSFGRPSIDPMWDWLDTQQDEPFLLWFAPMLPHVPIDPGSEWLDLYEGLGLSSHAQNWYAQISRFDGVVGELLDGLAMRGFDFTNTLFILVADNGWQQLPFENHPIGNRVGGPDGKFSIHELGHRTPIVLAGPGWPVIQHDEVVTFEHVFATMLDVAEVPLPTFLPAPLTRGVPAAARAYTVRDRIRYQEVAPNYLRDGFAAFVCSSTWHYTVRDDGPPRLYDIRADPHLLQDVSGDHPEVASHLAANLDHWLAVPEPRAASGVIAALATCALLTQRRRTRAI